MVRAMEPAMTTRDPRAGAATRPVTGWTTACKNTMCTLLSRCAQAERRGGCHRRCGPQASVRSSLLELLTTHEGALLQGPHAGNHKGPSERPGLRPDASKCTGSGQHLDELLTEEESRQKEVHFCSRRFWRFRVQSAPSRLRLVARLLQASEHARPPW